MTPGSDAFAAALQHHRAGRLAEAAQLYQTALHENPAHTDAMSNLGALMTSIGEYAAAATMYEQVLALLPDDAVTLSNLGNLMQAQGRLRDAETYYRRALDEDPGLAAAQVNLGNVFRADNRLEDAVRCYESALAIDPRLAQAHNNLGVVLQGLGRTTEAADHLATALSIHPDNADARNNFGNILTRQNRHRDALHHFREAIRLKPDWAPPRFNLGTALAHLGDTGAAETALRAAIDLRPDYLDALQALATLLMDTDVFEESEALLTRCREIDPDSAETWFLVGSLDQRRGRKEDALAAYTRASELCDTVPEIFNNLGIAYQQLRRHAEAVTVFEKALALNPEFAHAYNNLGHSYMELDRKDDAIAAFRRAIAIAPEQAINHANLGIVLQSLGRFNDALHAFDEAARLNPDLPEAHNGRGITLQGQNRHGEAIASFETAIRLRDRYPEALNNLAISYQEVGRVYDAIQAYRDVIEIEPEHRQVYYNLGSLLQGIGRHDEAVGIFYRAIQVSPDYTDIYPYLAHSLMQQCSWWNIEAVFDTVVKNTERQLAAGVDVTISPFALQSVPCSMQLRLDVARHMSRKVSRRVANIKEQLTFDYPATRGERLRIGYVSPDFRYHSVGLAFKGLLEHHDRDRFEIFGYSVGTWKGLNDPVADYFPTAFDHYLDISATPFVDAARQINDDGIHILIDLAGHTRGHRPEIFAYRPAPLQAHYLGFSTTIGADYIDYLISDRLFMPETMAPYCSESLLYLPETMFAATRPGVSERPMTRAEFGIPEDAFVFANFNGHYKMHPRLFSVWMRIMRRVPGSVLWLMRGTETSRTNLRREAENQGVDPSRLIFADHMQHADHIARQKLADLVLDHLYHGGGVTSSDALWVGLPVLTVAGKTPASRNGITLLTAVGMPELVTDDLKDYERTAIELATHPARYAEMRAKLNRKRLTEPLFDTERLTRHLERGYDLIWENRESGNAPRQISVPALPRRT
jgi:protein O-GlcNAc transferase